MWHDWIFSIGSLVLWLGLLPSVFSRNKPDTITSVTSSVVLFIFALLFVTLDLWLSGVVTLMSSATWAILAIQVILKKEDDIDPRLEQDIILPRQPPTNVRRLRGVIQRKPPRPYRPIFTDTYEQWDGDV